MNWFEKFKLIGALLSLLILAVGSCRQAFYLNKVSLSERGKELFALLYFFFVGLSGAYFFFLVEDIAIWLETLFLLNMDTTTFLLFIGYIYLVSALLIIIIKQKNVGGKKY